MSRFRAGPRAARQQLERLLNCASLHEEPRLRDLLAYLVEETLAGRAARLDHSTVGVEVFQRETTFDSNAEPMVHNQVDRLRRAVQGYYLAEGIDSPVRLDIPEGSLVPSFLAVGPRSAGLPALESAAGSKLARPRGPGDTAVVVLPLRCDSGSPADASAGTGIAAEIGLRLTRFEHIQVIASHSAQRHAGSGQINLKRIGTDLDARFVLAGKLDLTTRAMSLGMRLYDSHAATLLWSHRYEFEHRLPAMLIVLNEIAHAAAACIGTTRGHDPVALNDACLGRPPRDMRAFTAVMFQRHQACQTVPLPLDRQRENLRSGLEVDPDYAVALAMLSKLELDRSLQDNSRVGPLELDAALDLADRAVDRDPDCQQAHWSMAYARLHRHEATAAVDAAERAVAANPYDADICGGAGWVIALAGSWERGLALLATNHRLNPYHPRCWLSAWILDRYRQGDYEGASHYAGLCGDGDGIWGPLLECAALGQSGRNRDAAAAAASRMLSLRPDFRDRGRTLVRRRIFVQGLDELVLDGIRKAGVAVD